MTPNALPSACSSGAHMTERMRKSAIDWARPNRLSVEASSLSSAWPVSRHCCTMLLLKRAVVSVPARRVLIIFGTSRPDGSSRKIRKQRSAWRKSWNRLSAIFGKRASSSSVFARLVLMSSRALIFSAGCDSRSWWLLSWPVHLASTVEELSPSGSASGSSARRTAGNGLRIDAVLEGAEEIADFDAVVVLQQGAAADLLVVDEGAVAAFAVLDVILALDAKDMGVLAADGGVVDDDLAVAVPAEDDLVVLQLEAPALLGAFENEERSHVHGLSRNAFPASLALGEKPILTAAAGGFKESLFLVVSQVGLRCPRLRIGLV